MPKSRNEEIVKKFFKTLSAGKLDKLRPLLHKDATWNVMATGIPGVGEKKGHKGILDEFLGPARGMFVDGDPKVLVDCVVAKGPMVAVEAHGLGKFRNGKDYNNRYAFMIQIKDGKVFALREYMDSYYVSTIV